jgi:uncharacterized protein (TIGR02145 family)
MKKHQYPLLLSFFCLFLSSCIDENEFKAPEIEYINSQVFDKQGNSYITIKIGDQWWTQEDFKATSLSDGKEITRILDPKDWSSSKTPSFIQGATSLLYNYKALEEAANMLPQGWRVASDNDFKNLEVHLGMSSSEVEMNFWRGEGVAVKLKEDYQKGVWRYFDGIWADNSSGFKALPCGCILFNGQPCEPSNQSQGFWWTSTMQGENVWFRNLDYKSNKIFRYVTPSNYGMAIRFVKDN